MENLDFDFIIPEPIVTLKDKKIKPINYPFELSLVVKELQGIRWGKSELSRAMNPCIELYQYFDESPLKKYGTTYDIAVCCIRDIAEWLEGTGMSWSVPGAISKYRGKWERQILTYGCFKKEIFR